MNATAMLNEQKPSNLILTRACVRRPDGPLTADILVREVMRYLDEQATIQAHITDLRTALGADANTSHEECVTAAVEGRKALAAEGSAAAEIPGDALVMLEQLRDTLPEFTTDPTEFVICIIDALKSERASTVPRASFEYALKAVRQSEEALAAEKRAHSKTQALFGSAVNWETDRCDRLSKMNDSLRSDLAARDATIGGYKEALNVARGERDHALTMVGDTDRLRKESADLREKLRQAEAKRDEYLADARQLLDERNTFIEEHRAARAESASLTERLAFSERAKGAMERDLRAISERLTTVERERDTAQGEAFGHAGAIEERDETIADLTRQIDAEHETQALRAQLAARSSEGIRAQIERELPKLKKLQVDAIGTSEGAAAKWKADIYEELIASHPASTEVRWSEGLREAIDSSASATVERLEGACDGPGWYYWDDEYPEEGVVGAFATREEAEAHAREAGYILASHPAENPTVGAWEIPPSAVTIPTDGLYQTPGGVMRLKAGDLVAAPVAVAPSDAPEQAKGGATYDTKYDREVEKNRLISGSCGHEWRWCEGLDLSGMTCPKCGEQAENGAAK